MAATDPYRTPSADLAASPAGIDQTRPWDPGGRFGRLSYVAWAVLASVVINLVSLLLELALGAVAGGGGQAGGAAAIAIGILTLLFGVGLAVVTVLFAIRRLHDLDLSGWWCLLGLVPLVNVLLGLFLLLKGGTDGVNRFGPPRPTPTWEAVVGGIGLVLSLLALLALIVMLVVILMNPAMLEQWQSALQSA